MKYWAATNTGKKSLSSILYFLSFLFFLCGCTSVDPVVKIGLVGPFEGQYRDVGYDVIYSARLAIGEINEAGGIGGYRIGLVALDDSGDPELAAQTAASLAIDPDVVAVVGHWLPETTAAAAPLYAEAELPFIAGGTPPFTAVDPRTLPQSFHLAYEATTPFDEVAGDYAAPAYDAFQLLWQALEKAAETEGVIDRNSVQNALPGLKYNGLTGMLYQPQE